MTDGHVHLERGPLTKEYVYRFVDKAVEMGIDDIQILDHTHRFSEFSPIYEPLRFIKPQEEWMKRDLKDSIFEYIDLIEEMKKESFPIKVSFGLEVCYQANEEDVLRKLLSVYNWDFLVGSIHTVDYIEYDSSWSIEYLWEKYPVDEIYKKYYDMMFKLIKSGLFTQLAHPDTIKMFNYYPSYDLTETYEELAMLVNKYNMKVENNVGCFYRYNHKDMGLSDELLHIFKKNHCSLITATDAHKPEDVGIYIKDIWEKTMEE